MTRLAAGVVLALLASCERSYEPLASDCVPGRYTVDFVILDGPELDARFREATGSEAGQLEGFTILGEMPAVYVLPLRGGNDSRRLQTWGHELAHVVCGLWHGEEDKW